ncbi:MAG: DUF721 domain-containing protein [Rhodospirillales bacterium]
MVKRQGMRALAETVAAITAPVFRKRGFADGAIVADWPAIVGEALATHSAPERVSYPRGRSGEGTLRLRIARGGLATELQHLEPVLVERINGYFGYRAIAHLQFVHGPLPPRPPARRMPERRLTTDQESELAAALAAVDEPKLREALERLGRVILGRTAG